jgi:abortive infection bacteriophage resistance protein
MTTYGGKFPLWAISELFTFGMLSYFFADMITADQKHIAFNSFNTTVVKMKSWLRCCTDLRNFCAHYSRLYNRVFPAVPVSLAHVDNTNENSIFAAIMALRALYPNVDKWNGVFMPLILTAFYEHRNVICNEHIGFPDDWVTILRK